MLLNLLKNILPRQARATPPPTPPDGSDGSPASEHYLEQLRFHSRAAQLALPGSYYVDVIANIHALAKPRTYLEIGVNTGVTFGLAAATTRALGVDPLPLLKQPPGPNAKIFPLTSDDFFAQTDVKNELGGLPVDLAFIDGMHLFEFALRDFIAIERLCTRESTVLVHDTYPLNSVTAERERESIFWSGDIWRLVLALKKYRPDLSIDTLAAAPSGLTIIRGLDPDSRVLADRRDAIIAEFLALDFSILDADKTTTLNVVPNTTDQIRKSLGDALREGV
jgi:hypothetical protein